jgi:hypothetical protein
MTRVSNTFNRAITTLTFAVGAMTTAPAIVGAQGNAAPRTPDLSKPLITAPSPDPRVGLKAGLQDAGSAIWNMKLIGHVPSDSPFYRITNSDLAFSGNNVIQGNYNGFQIWNISDPTSPKLRIGKLCPASQSDVSVYKNFLFVSAEAPTARMDCGAFAVCASSTSPTSTIRSIWRTCRPAAARIRTRWSTIRGTTRTSTSTSRVRRRFVRPKS